MLRRLLIFGLAAAGLIVGAYVMPRINPFFASSPRVGRSEAKQIAEACLRDQRFDNQGFFCDEFFDYHASGLDYLMGVFGVETIIDLGREDRLPLSYWQFYYYRNVPKDTQQETFTVRVSPKGKLVGFSHVVPDSASGDSLTSEQAVQFAKSEMQSWADIRFADFQLEQSTSAKKARRIDHKLVFSRKSEIFGEGSEVIEINFAGATLTKVWRYFRNPEDFLAASGVAGSANVLFNTISVIVYVFLLVWAIAAFLRKYHDGEIGVRTGLWLAGIVFFALIFYAINHWERLASSSNFGGVSQLYSKFILFGLQIFFGYILIAVMTFASWTVGEHALRTDKPRLLAGVDSLFNHKWLTKNIGREVPVGVAFGLMTFGLIYLLSFAMVEFGGALPRLSGGMGGGFDFYLPVFGTVVNILMCAFFDEMVFRLFSISLLRRKFKSPSVAIIISAVLYGFFLIFFADAFSFRPGYATLAPAITIGLIQGLVFWRYGLLAAMISNAVFSSMNSIGPLLGAEASFLFGNGIAGVVTLLGLLVVGWIGYWRGEEFEYNADDEPAHIRRIKERVRLQKELEIARRVQLGLLPKTQPSIAGFDIAGACQPALEVGGDYFDYVDLHDGNLGIAVGDVSGKGVPAAIYMTLTKGILQSHAEEEHSPKQVLSKVNHLMYRTIERSWYVSMFYAVLDSRKKVLRFARAGHNPAIVFSSGKSESRLLKPSGIGLGLEVGPIFVKTLVEGELQLSHGDTLVFYTDGFTEAMNNRLEEFGEERFLDLLHRHSNGSAANLVQHAFDEVRDFAGDHPQHDDMTIVVLKAK
jgi:sigma-B regulation protein RsbU (phosphoserine phosphatase)